MFKSVSPSRTTSGTEEGGEMQSGKSAGREYGSSRLMLKTGCNREKAGGSSSQ